MCSTVFSLCWNLLGLLMLPATLYEKHNLGPRSASIEIFILAAAVDIGILCCLACFVTVRVRSMQTHINSFGTDTVVFKHSVCSWKNLCKLHYANKNMCSCVSASLAPSAMTTIKPSSTISKIIASVLRYVTNFLQNQLRVWKFLTLERVASEKN